MNDLLASQRLHTMKSGYNSNTSPRTDITPRSHRISKELNNQSSPEHLNTSEVLIEEIKEPQANLTQKFEQSKGSLLNSGEKSRSEKRYWSPYEGAGDTLGGGGGGKRTWSVYTLDMIEICAFLTILKLLIPI